MGYLFSLLAFIISLLIAIIIIPRILIIAHKLYLYDLPDERKIHSNPIPRIGGLSFFYCILFTIFSMFIIFHLFYGAVEQYVYSNSYFLCALLILHLGRMKDDLIGMRYRYKFFLQISASLLIVSSGLYINNFYGLFGIEAINIWIGVPLTVLLIVFVINAMNLIDGIDGLSSGISIFALGVYGILFLLQDVWQNAILAFSTIGVLCVFFCYNVFGSVEKKHKLFMGDTGSMMLGLILSFLAIQYMYYSPGSIKLNNNNTLVVAISPIIIPILDVLRVILSRIKNHKHLFTADRCHIHHKLIKIGYSEIKTLIVLLGTTNGFYFFNFLMIPFLNTLTIFIIDIVIWTSGNMYLSYLIRKKNVEAAIC